jgi:hypothetical protein
VTAPSFADATHVLAHLCKALAAPLLVVAQDQDASLLREALGRAAQLRLEVATYASSRAWLQLMTDNVKGNDLVLLWGVRERDPAFSTEYSDFATTTFLRHSQNDIVMYFPRSDVLATPAPEPAPATEKMPPRTGTVVMRKV